MLILDIIKRFSLENKIVLDCYDSSTYSNMISKLTEFIDILKIINKYDKMFDLEKSYFISNINVEDETELPFIITNIDYDTLGVNIDYNLLNILKVDIAFLNTKIRYDENNVAFPILSLDEVELLLLLDKIIKRLQFKIVDVSENTDLINVYKKICALYSDKNDSIMLGLKKSNETFDKRQKKLKVVLDIKISFMLWFNQLRLMLSIISSFFINYGNMFIKWVVPKFTVLFILIYFKLSFLIFDIKNYFKNR